MYPNGDWQHAVVRHGFKAVQHGRELTPRTHPATHMHPLYPHTACMHGCNGCITYISYIMQHAPAARFLPEPVHFGNMWQSIKLAWECCAGACPTSAARTATIAPHREPSLLSPTLPPTTPPAHPVVCMYALQNRIFSPLAPRALHCTALRVT